MIVLRDEAHADAFPDVGGVLGKDRVPSCGIIGREGNIDARLGQSEKGIASAGELIVPAAKHGLRDNVLRVDGMLARRSEKESCCCNGAGEHLGE